MACAFHTDSVLLSELWLTHRRLEDILAWLKTLTFTQGDSKATRIEEQLEACFSASAFKIKLIFFLFSHPEMVFKIMNRNNVQGDLIVITDTKEPLACYTCVADDTSRRLMKRTHAQEASHKTSLEAKSQPCLVQLPHLCGVSRCRHWVWSSCILWTICQTSKLSPFGGPPAIYEARFRCR